LNIAAARRTDTIGYTEIEPMLKLLRWVRDRKRQSAKARLAASINKILSKNAIPDTRRPEADFDALQDRYPPRPEYGYDPFSLFQRAANRAVRILAQACAGDKRLRILDIGAGDGMLGALLAAAGHDVTLCDLEDWRTEPAKGLQFIATDCCVEIPRQSDEFDLVCSFNSFEHLVEPGNAFEEIVRVTRPGALMYFDFGPLYCSPWGLHAYRSLRMPYPQYLFSSVFVNAKLEELGIWDLGKARSELQTLNRWTKSQFGSLWTSSKVERVELRPISDEEHLSVILQYPECFCGRGLTFQDVTCSGIMVTLRKGK
jgi:SAM-dependent methyltransferase